MKSIRSVLAFALLILCWPAFAGVCLHGSPDFQALGDQYGKIETVEVNYKMKRSEKTLQLQTKYYIDRLFHGSHSITFSRNKY